MTALTYPASVAPVPLLRAALPGISREMLAEQIIGRLCHQIDCPKSYLDVLYALIAHAGWHSNRAWASYKRLAELASRIAPTKWRTAQRAMAFWCSKLGIRVIRDQDELLAGPGEHDYVDAGKEKRGDGPVNHYDLTALLAYVPQEFAAALDTLIDGGQYHPERTPTHERPKRNLAVEYPDTLTDPPVPPVEPHPLTLQDPFGDAPPTSEESSTLLRTSHQEAPSLECNLPIEKSGEEGSKKAPTEQGSGNAFDVPKVALISEGLWDPATDPSDHPAFLTLRTVGIHTRMLKKMFREAGAGWMDILVRYGREQGIRDGEPKGAGWYVGVFKNWQRGEGSWPDHYRALLACTVTPQSRKTLERRRPVVAATPSAPGPTAAERYAAEIAPLPVEEQQRLKESAMAALVVPSLRDLLGSWTPGIEPPASPSHRYALITDHLIAAKQKLAKGEPHA